MDTFPKCSVCHQEFTLKGQVPYLLPCLHAVCETCVTSAAGGVISCSKCQREVNLTDTSLQKDAVRQKQIFHLTVKHRPTELLCTHEDDGNQAVCWCQECEEFLCEYCQNMHSSFKLSRNHVVHNFGDINPQNLEIETNCSIHERYPLDLFDKSCIMCICSQCRRGEHADHEVGYLDEAAEGVTQRIEQHGKDLSALLSRQQTHLQSIRQETQLTNRTQDTLRKTIEHTFRSLRSQLDQREKELLIDLESQTRETKATLHALEASCEEHHARCTDISGYIRKCLLYASKSVLLQLETTVEGMTRTCLETASPETHDVPEAVFNTNGLSKLKSDMSGFGNITTLKEDSEGGTPEDKQTQTDDDYLADLEQKHKMELAKLKSTIALDNERTEQLQQLTDKLNADANNMKLMLAEKEQSCQVALENIHHLQTFLIDFPTEGCVHLLKTGVADRRMVLHCLHLKYDKDRVNLDYVDINTEGDLVNRKSDTRPAGEGRLKNYSGTCSSAPLPRAGCPQYWEVESRVNLHEILTGYTLILEVGVCREEQRDVYHRLGGSAGSYSMTVTHCTAHGAICRMTWKEGEYVLHQPDTLPNTAGASHTLHYGVVYDDARKKIVFIDVKENKVISTLDNVDSSQPLWPMFGVYNSRSLTVSMTLVVGSDINMTEEKKAMIVKALS
ncbi:transcription intermediary factor 1-alpha-like isoform X1 [Haliotis rufescens]|uniref:transcription intermediary factor 1-alpha-like isoform X1 n=1 Tax=Haliotis rufescens TaxID=6454 RepID=UPI00201F93B8|nr:transcription intermediary factor 1-alpha-like isoform X1 [Haliotis rufescens]XP_048248964.1 transcription intermediary factor 1-alpha-like isoform X1 [Haliotis rufescens]XP_048248965.1 transcription intermediary factor 1-alpha-like isoform X1 [Haliotis rufescens]XP_048248967.1 transcription intermediary factor 1-alpha-like isoform X1 [Haliotis rufescens]